MNDFVGIYIYLLLSFGFLLAITKNIYLSIVGSTMIFIGIVFLFWRFIKNE